MRWSKKGYRIFCLSLAGLLNSKLLLRKANAEVTSMKKSSTMEQSRNIPKSIDEYIAQFPQEIQEILNKLRQVIKESAPNTEEKISYGMPTFVLNGNLVHFAAYKNHIGFYPTSSGINTFKQELSGYKTSKGAVQFPIGKNIPYELVSKIVKFRVSENKKKAEKKIKKNK